MIGQERKFNRLYELQQYWTNKVKHHPRVIINHPQHKSFSGALGNMGIKDKKPDDLATYLFDNYKIHVVAINWENIHGIRITPNVYTTKAELDKLVKGILKFADERG
jgi:selenocysteine lyase/cysteine desulfurase